MPYFKRLGADDSEIFEVSEEHAEHVLRYQRYYVEVDKPKLVTPGETLAPETVEPDVSSDEQVFEDLIAASEAAEGAVEVEKSPAKAKAPAKKKAAVKVSDNASEQG